MAAFHISRILRAILCVGLFCLIGCTYSIYPFLKDEQVIQDKSLSGMWIYQGEKSKGVPLRIEITAQSEYQHDTDGDMLFPALFRKTGQPLLPEWGYRMQMFDHHPEITKIELLYVRLGKIGTMTIAEFVAPTTQIDSGLISFAEIPMVLPLYTCAKVEMVSKDHVRFFPLNTLWLRDYQAKHPDELTVLPAENENLVLNVKTDEMQAFLIKHAQQEQLWTKGSFDLVRFASPAAQSATSLAPSTEPAAPPAGAATQPAPGLPGE